MVSSLQEAVRTLSDMKFPFFDSPSPQFGCRPLFSSLEVRQTAGASFSEGLANKETCRTAHVMGRARGVVLGHNEECWLS